MENRYVYISKAYFQLLVADIIIFMSDSDPGNSYICIFDQADNSSLLRGHIGLRCGFQKRIYQFYEAYSSFISRFMCFVCITTNCRTPTRIYIYISFMKHIHQLCMHIGKRKCLPSKSIFCMQMLISCQDIDPEAGILYF